MKAALNSQINPSQYPYRPYLGNSRAESGGILSPPMQIPTPHRLVFDSPMLNDESEKQLSSEGGGPLSVSIPDRPQALLNHPLLKP